MIEWRTGLRLTVIGFVAVAAPFWIDLLNAPPSRAQRPADIPKLAFDIASVKVNTSGKPGGSVGGLESGGLYRATNTTLRPLIATIYLETFFKRRLVLGGPAWIDSEHFDIEARAKTAFTPKQRNLMVQSLLEDRFKRAVHHETRQLPIYALVLSRPGKIGPRLTPHSKDAKCSDGPLRQPAQGDPMPAYCGGFFMAPAAGALRESGNGISLDMLASFLSQSVDRDVKDRTGLRELFDFTIEFAPEQGPGYQAGGAGSAADPFVARSIFTAINEQLGLKLKSQRGPVDVLVIDHIEQPSPN